jgi:hypothetical protein
MPMSLDPNTSNPDYDRSNGPAVGELFDDSPEGRERRDFAAPTGAGRKALRSQFQVFGVRFGYDAILSLIPVAGDAAGAAVGAWIFWKAQQLGVPGRVKTQMVTNVAFDAVLGSIPVIGTVFDVAYKSNTRNSAATLRHDDRDQQVAPVALAAMVAGGADELDRHAGVDRLHDGLVEAVQVIGDHADHGLLVGCHGGRLFFSTFLDAGLDCHGISPLVIRGSFESRSGPIVLKGTLIRRPGGTARARSIPSWRSSRTGRR